MTIESKVRLEAARARWTVPAWLGGEVARRAVAILSPVALLLLWEGGVRLGEIDARFFPAPSAILAKTWDMAVEGSLWGDLSASLQRLFWGCLIGGVPGIVLGLAMGLSRLLRAALDPLVAATYPIPKSAILPLVLLIFGLGEASKIVMVALGMFYPVVMSTAAGVRQIERIYIDVGRAFGASRWQMFVTVALPGALPSIITGVKLGSGLGLILIAIAEMVGAEQGIGYMIWNSWQVLAVEPMYAGLIIMAVLGFAISILLDELQAKLCPWQRRS